MFDVFGNAIDRKPAPALPRTWIIRRRGFVAHV
jgi:hypothetical protein